MNARNPVTPGSAHPLAAPEVGAWTRREAIAALGAVGALAAVPGVALAQQTKQVPVPPGGAAFDSVKGVYTLPPLPYDFAALEPHIDAETMKIHHDMHHAAYVAGANKALAELEKIRAGESDASLVKHWARELSFHGSGHANHTLLWITMAPPGAGGGGKPSGDLAAQIDRDFGSFDRFVAQFQATANTVEGSGWGWLAWEPISRRLIALQGEKQQDLVIPGARPILGVDVWEHAYYLRYRNKRADYVKAFMNVINWTEVASLFDAARA